MTFLASNEKIKITFIPKKPQNYTSINENRIKYTTGHEIFIYSKKNNK